MNRAIEQLEDRLTPVAPVNPSFESGLTGWTLTGAESPVGLGSTVTAVAGGTSGAQHSQLNVPNQDRAPVVGWTGLTQFLRSSNFTMVSGEQILVDWRVTRNPDDAIGLGELRRTSDNALISTFFNVNSGSSTSYTTASFTTIVVDTYYVQFQGGTFDASLGGVAGAFLNVDNIRTVVPVPTIVYVDPSFTSAGANVDGDLTAGGNQAATVGFNAFSTIAAAMAAVASNGTVIVNTASYTESPTLGTPLAEFRTYSATVNGNLTANAGIGGTGITFTGTGITVTGTTLLSSAGNDVVLTAANDFVGNVTVTAANASLHDVNTLNFAASTLTGNLTATASTINVNGALATSGTGNISLTATQNVAVSANVTGGTGGVTLLGQGTAALNTHGVNITSRAVVSAAGVGAVSVTGTGGGGATAGANMGVRVHGAGTKITSGGGNVSVSGTGGSGSSNTGVYGITNGLITSGGSGTVTVTGNGGPVGNGIGVLLDDSGKISSGGSGAVSVTGTAPAGARGVWVFVNS